VAHAQLLQSRQAVSKQAADSDDDEVEVVDENEHVQDSLRNLKEKRLALIEIGGIAMSGGMFQKKMD